MGNRAVITDDMNGIGVYLHWNGGRDSVQAFLKYCELRGFRGVNSDKSYAYARLCQVIGNFFGGGLSIGVDMCKNLDCDNYDNGVYIIGGKTGWEIVGRKYHDGDEQDEYDMNAMLKEIDKKQPPCERLGNDYFDAKEVPVEELKVGDIVFTLDYEGYMMSAEVVGIGDGWVNGVDRTGMPYINIYGRSNERCKNNPNNYFAPGSTVRVIR